MSYVDLLAALGVASRFDVADAARAGACTLTFHGAFELTISAVPDAARVRLHAPLGVVGERDRARVFGDLLRVAVPRATRHRAHFGFDASRDRIILFRTLDLAAGEDVTQAVLAVESFVRQGIELLHTLPCASHPAPCAPARRMTSFPTSTFV